MYEAINVTMIGKPYCTLPVHSISMTVSEITILAIPPSPAAAPMSAYLTRRGTGGGEEGSGGAKENDVIREDIHHEWSRVVSCVW